MGRDQIGHYQFHIESCRSKPALQSRSSVQHSLAPTKSSSPQRITRRRSKGSGGEVREFLRGRPGGDADPQLERSRWPTEGCWGNLLNRTVVEDDASISLRRCLAGALQKRACRCWHGGVAPPASKWLAVTPPAVSGGRLSMHNSQVAASSAGYAAISTFARGGSRHNERAGSSLRLESRAFRSTLACLLLCHTSRMQFSWSMAELLCSS